MTTEAETDTEELRIRCARCRDRFPPEAFHRNKTAKTGRDSYCKGCRNAYLQEWIAKQPPEWRKMRAERTRAWEQANLERKREYQRDYARRRRARKAQEARP